MSKLPDIIIGSKPWYESRTIWGAIIMVAGTVLGIVGGGLSGEEQAQATDAVARVVGGLSELIGLALVIYGRVKASKKIG